MISCWNRGIATLTIAPGDRIAQLLLVPVGRARLRVVDGFTPSQRGERRIRFHRHRLIGRDDTRGTMARKEGGAGHALRIDLRRLLPLVGATILLVAGAFSAWQAWLIADEGDAAERTRAAQRQTVKALDDLIAGKRQQVQRALAESGLAGATDDRAAVAERLRAQLKGVHAVEVYSGGLDEVVRANYREFGYAKAAQLMAALGASETPPASTSLHGNERRLTMVEPVAADGGVRAWIWLEYPFDDVAARFEAASPGAGRIELRQGDGHDSLSLLSHGSRSAELEAEGQRVAGTSLYVFAAMPRAFIVIPHSVALRWPCWPWSGLAVAPSSSGPCAGGLSPPRNPSRKNPCSWPTWCASHACHRHRRPRRRCHVPR